jgi:hypothetical protein
MSSEEQDLEVFGEPEATGEQEDTGEPEVTGEKEAGPTSTDYSRGRW